ncbi:unnamed protein product [Sphagnum troendelagicum]|uniref:Uncharacterized protein n=1 Tax=Sphagnum troendelagicum TaxID=128251 RepID=A0ABP0TCU7_9BRYO
MGGARPPPHQLALHPPRGSRLRSRRQPPKYAQLPHGRFHLPPSTPRYPQELPPLLPLVRAMSQTLRRPPLPQESPPTSLGSHDRGRHGHLEGY